MADGRLSAWRSGLGRLAVKGLTPRGFVASRLTIWRLGLGRLAASGLAIRRLALARWITAFGAAATASIGRTICLRWFSTIS